MSGWSAGGCFAHTEAAGDRRFGDMRDGGTVACAMGRRCGTKSGIRCMILPDEREEGVSVRMLYPTSHSESLPEEEGLSTLSSV